MKLKELFLNIHNKFSESFIFLVLFFFVFYKSPFNFITTNDEVINTWKGSNFFIFDYSLRPLAFLFNSMCFLLFGNDHTTLPLVSCIIILATFFILNKVVNTKCHTEKYILLALVLSSDIWFMEGQLGMINTVLLLYTLSMTWIISRVLKNIETPLNHLTILGFLVSIGIAIHPTYYYILPGIFILLSLRFKSASEFLFFGVGASIPVILLETLYNIFYGSSYISLLLGVPSKISRYDHQYAKEFTFYWKLLWQSYSPIIAAVIYTIIFLFIKRINIIKYINRHWFLLSLASILMASIVSWKFPRVLVPVLPFVILSFFEIFRFFIDRMGRKHAIIILTPLLLLNIFFSFRKMTEHRAVLGRSYPNRTARADYLKSYNLKKIWVVEASIPDRSKSKLVKHSNNPYFRQSLYFPSAEIFRYKILWNPTQKLDNLFKKSEAILIKDDILQMISYRSFKELGFINVYNAEGFSLLVTKKKILDRRWQRGTLELEQ